MPAAYTPTTDFTVAPTRSLSATDQDAVWISQAAGSPPPNFTLQGQISVVATPAYSGAEIYGVRALGAFAGADFTMDFQSSLVVREQQTPVNGVQDLDSYGIVATDSPNLTISGNILVTATGTATDIVAPFSSLAGGVTLKQGVVEAVSVDGAAYGVRMESGGTFENNNGSIEAHAHTVAVGVSINGDHGAFHNDGIISADGAQGGAGAYGIAVQWKSASVPGAGGAFVNDGMLMGDFALVARADVVNPLAVQVFVNNVAMVGKVDLGEAPAQLINNGRIDGQITFGGSNDLYDGHAGPAAASVVGGGGDDTLIGGVNADTLSGGAGDDVIDGGAGANLLDGGAGLNTLSFRSAAAGVSADLQAGTASGGSVETFRRFQRVLGGDHGDTITGSAGADSVQGGSGANIIQGADGDDTLAGGMGADTISGGAGDDLIDGGAGADHLDGGAGVNTLSFRSAVTGVSVDLSAGTATAASAETISNFQRVLGGDHGDTISGSAGADSILGGAADNVLHGDDGADTIVGGAGFNAVNGNKGDDSIVGHSATGDWLLGGQGGDQIDARASTGHNILNGNMGADTVTGANYGDTLRGGQGDDLIHGGAGNDLLFGDLGNNTISGGAGADTFHNGAGAARDTITDFQQAEGDRVQIEAALTYVASQTSGGVEVAVSNGDVIVLQNVQLKSLADGWIVDA